MLHFLFCVFSYQLVCFPKTTQKQKTEKKNKEQKTFEYRNENATTQSLLFSCSLHSFFCPCLSLL